MDKSLREFEKMYLFEKYFPMGNYPLILFNINKSIKQKHSKKGILGNKLSASHIRQNNVISTLKHIEITNKVQNFLNLLNAKKIVHLKRRTSLCLDFLQNN